MVDIRKAATVLLVRPSEKGPELFMLQRPGRGVFPDLHVFPGGKVDQEDADLEASCFGLNEQLAARKLGLKDNAIRYWVTVIRECFEESGVLLVRRQGKDFYFRDDAERSHYQGLRERLLAASRNGHCRVAYPNFCGDRRGRRCKRSRGRDKVHQSLQGH